MKDIITWYDRQRLPYQSDRNTVEAYAGWLKPIPWQLFCTFTFAWRVSDPQAIKVFDAFINRLERLYKADVCYVRGDEKRFSGCGKPACARHFHALLACAAPLIPWSVELLWKEIAGNRKDGTGALARPYDQNLEGASYALKFINQLDGDWAPRKLELFLPDSMFVQDKTARSRRRLRRHLQRQQSFATDR
jgi:hypothetical protein